MGERIYDARQEAGLSQQDLARLIYKRQATLSDYENGKALVDSSTLVLLAYSLDKALGYFYPPYLYQEIKQEDLTPLESELILQFRKDLISDHLRKVVINVVKAISTFDVDSFVLEQYPLSKDIVEEKERINKLRENRKKK